MIFFSIPKYILLNIVQSFCTIGDVGKLEIALGNVHAVKVLRNYFQSSSITLHDDERCSRPVSLVWWLSSRELLLSELNVAIALSNWKKIYEHQKNDCYTSLTKLSALFIDCSTPIPMDIKGWFTRVYQYVIGTSHKQILCSAIQLLVQSDQLTTLEIVGAPFCIDDTLTSLAKKLHMLTSLRLEDCKKISTVTVEALVRNNTGLRRVGLRNNTNLWARVLIDSVLTEHLSHSLTELDLTYTNYEAHYATSSLTSLFQKCAPLLTSLSTNTWDALINAHQFPCLTSLRIEYSMENYVLYYSVPFWHSPTHLLRIVIDVSATTDITTYYIAKSHPQLLSLRLIGSDFLTVVAVQDILKYCRHIQHLGLVNCCLLSSDTVYNIANKRPPTLTSLDMRGLQGISTDSVLHLLNMFVHLKELDVRDCIKLDTTWLDDYCRENAHLHCNVKY